jgi:hypothetical protein
VSSLRAVSAGVLAVVLVACSGGGTVGELDEVLDGDVALDEVDLDLDALGLPVAVEVSPAVVGPGERVTVTAEGAPGATVALLRGGEVVAEAPLADGGLTVPTDAEDGMHTVQVERDEALVGVAGVRVASEPGVWLASDRRYAAEGEAFTLRLTAHEVPDDAVVVIGPEGLLDDDWEDDFDDDDWWDDDFDDDWDDEWFDDPDAVVTIYVPHPAGALVPIGGMQLAAPDRLPRLGDVAGIDLAVPAAIDLTRPLQATVFTHGGPAASWTSNTVSVERCDQPGAVVGSTDGPALVTAVWVDGDIRVSRVEADGPFELAAGPGPTTVTVDALDVDDETAPVEGRVEIVNVPCGGVAELASAGPQIVTAGMLARGHRAGMSAGPPVDPCRKLRILTAGTDDQLQRLALTIAGTGAITLRNGLSRVEVVAPQDIRTVLDRQAQDQLLGLEEDGFSLDDEVLRRMLDADFTMRVDLDRVGRTIVMLVTVVRSDGVTVASAQEQARRPAALLRTQAFESLAEAIAQAGICAEVEPEEARLAPDEEEVLAFRVTDLNDQDAEGAEITPGTAPDCGELDPPQVTVEGDSAEMTYTATARGQEECVDELPSEVDWPDGAPQPVQAEAPSTMRVGGRFRVEMTTGLDPDAILEHVPLFFAVDMDFEARNCDGEGILGTWEGTFDADMQLLGPFLGEAAEAGSFPVMFDLPQNGGRFALTGIEQLGMYGEYYPTADYIAVLIDGDVLMGGEIEKLDEDAPC